MSVIDLILRRQLFEDNYLLEIKAITYCNLLFIGSTDSTLTNTLQNIRSIFLF